MLIPRDFSTFSKCNLESVHQEVRKLLKTWQDKTLSWFERIMLIKMMVFPKYLFLFQTAPLHITSALLESWQRALVDFVWSYKKPWLPLNLVTATKDTRGLALLHLKLYYEATVLSTLLKHYSGSYQAAWNHIEDHDFRNKTFQEVIWMSRWSRIKTYTPSLLCCAVLKVWDTYRHAITTPHS